MKKTLLLCVALFTATLLHAQEFASGNFNYSVTTAEEEGAPDTVSLIGTAEGVTLPLDLIIPATVSNEGTDYAVTLIANQAFKDAAITSLTVQGETIIGNQSFWGAKSLVSVDAPLSTVIFNQAFRSCEALTTVNIPKVISIGVQSFRACLSLKHIDLPSATTLGAGVGAGLTFWQSTALETINMPVMDSISVGAFNGCAALKSITLPASLTKLDETNFNMFKGCTSLTEVNIEYTTFIPLTKDTEHVNVSIFNDVTANATLSIVGTENMATYQSSDVWKDFAYFTLGIHSPEAALGWDINTNGNNLTITNDASKNAEVVVYNIGGSTLLNAYVVNGDSQVDITSLSSGVYILKVNTDNGIFTKKFVKQ